MILSLFSLLALLPSGLQALRPQPARDALLWACLVVGVTGTFVPVFAANLDQWQTSFSASLWATVAATMGVFLVLVAASRHAWRLTPIVIAFLFCFGLLALLWQGVPGSPLSATIDEAEWIVLHIAAALVTYSMATLAAVSALAAYLQERAVKRKRWNRITQNLPSVLDCERLVVGLLAGAEGILAAGVASGMALSYRETGALLDVSHKTILTLSAFIIIGAVLIGYLWGGVRGKRAVRWVLFAYLTLCLGYPGVKFVTDVVVGAQ